MRKLLLFTIAVTATIGGGVPDVSAANSGYETSLVERVTAAFSEPLFDNQGNINVLRPSKCGTPLLLEIRLAWPDLSDVTREAISASVQLERPELDEFYDSPDGRYRLHFSRSGPDSVDLSQGLGAGDVPVYVLTCAELMQEVYDKEVGELGFRAPLSDSTGNPDEDPRFDIYFIDYGQLFYGLTFPDFIFKMDGEEAYWATSHLRIHSQFRDIPPYKNKPFEAMKVTLAHEFNHSIHWTYDVEEAEVRPNPFTGNPTPFPWFLEASATAMEEFVFDEVNDYYAYLPSFMNNPWMSIRTFENTLSAEGLHPYASCLWFIYLAEKYDQVLLREIWDECGKVAGFNTFDAFRTVLQNRDSTTSFEAEWAEFLVGNYFTGRRAVPWSYEEAAQYPEIPEDLLPLYDTYPVSESSFPTGPVRPVDELGAQYLRFLPPLADTSVTFKIQITPAGEFEEWMVITAGLNGSVEPVINVTQDILNPIEVPDWQLFEELLVIITPFKSDPQQAVLTRLLGYGFEVKDSINTAAARTAVRKVFPNPFRISDGAGQMFKIKIERAEAVDVSMSIYTLDGRLVVDGADRDNMNRPAEASTVFLEWDGTNRSNVYVASGVYLALVRIGDQRELIKVAIRNEMK